MSVKFNPRLDCKLFDNNTVLATTKRDDDVIRHLGCCFYNVLQHGLFASASAAAAFLTATATLAVQGSPRTPGTSAI